MCNSVCVSQICFYPILGIRSSRQPTDTSTAEKETSASSTTSAYVSATATGNGGRPPRSVTNSSRWATEVSAPSRGVSRTSGTIGSSPTSPVRATYGARGTRETTGFSQPVEDPLLPHSHSSAEGPTGELELEVKSHFYGE